MITRKQMKKKARENVFHHYAILLAVCLLAVFLGTEFSGSIVFMKMPSRIRAYADGNVSTGAVVGIEENGFWHVISDLLSGDIDKGRQDADVNNTNEENSGNGMFGRSRGVLAWLVNGFTSGNFLVKTVNIFYKLGFSQNAVLGTAAFLFLLINFGFWFLVKNMYKAVSRRMFLECRTYEKVTPQRFLFFMRAKKWLNVSVNMFMTYLLYLLWSLTIAGAFIKRYSYYMVPYIVAENPEISWRESITLSRKMMDGHKWECFVFELTFMGWKLLGILTLGISDLLYVNAYKTATFAEYYAVLREIAKDKHLENSELMNDTYLFEQADGNLLKEKYADIIKLKEEPAVELKLGIIRGFLARNFGVTLYNRTDEEKYCIYRERLILIATAEYAVDGKAYPDRLSPNPVHQKNSRFIKNHYLRHYSVTSLILIFFIFSITGWIWEVSLHLFQTGEFANRGVMHGPWLPIYGCGGVLVLTLLYKLRKSPLLEFAATIVLCGIIEYFTSYFLEITHGGMKWWDYRGYFLNLNGRICAEGLFVFGAGGMITVYLIAPAVDNWLRKIKRPVTIALCVILAVLFIGDQLYSHDNPNMGKGITNAAGAKIEAAAENG